MKLDKTGQYFSKAPQFLVFSKTITVSPRSQPLEFDFSIKNEPFQQQIFPEKQSMLKVVIVVRQLVLRIKQCIVDVVVKKNKESLYLGSQLKVNDGFCQANLTTEFYLDPNDAVLNIQIIILQENQRKLAGTTSLNLFQYQEAVYHETISVLHNCPDKQARILFNFVYFKDSSVIDKRHMFLSSNRYKEEYENIQKKNNMLQSQNKQLEKELSHEEKRNETLALIKEERQVGYEEREKAFKEQVEFRQKNIDDWNQKYQQSKIMKEELLQLVKAKGLGTKEDL